MAWTPMASPRLDLRVAFFGGRLDSYGVDAYGLDSYGCPPDWPWGTHFSVIVRRWVAWICMASPDWTCGSHFSLAAWIPVALIHMAWIPTASPRLDLGVALFVGRLDPHGMDPYGLEDPRLDLGSPWLGSRWLGFLWLPPN